MGKLHTEKETEKGQPGLAGVGGGGGGDDTRRGGCWSQEKKAF